MKILKYLLFLILIVIIGGAIYFGTKDGTYDISDSKIINAPAEVVFNKVNEYKTWEEWGPWKAEDSTMTFNYPEKTSGEGASYSWNGDMSGSMTTTKVIPNSEIQQNLTLNTPAGERNSKVYWFFEDVDGGTKVTWGMKGEHTLIDKMFYSFSDMDFEAEMHKMNQQGLESIENSVEEDMKEYTINVDGVTQYGGGYYMYVTTVSKMNEIGDKMAGMFDQVSGYMKQNNIPMSGMPFTIYNEVDDLNGTVIFSTAIPIKERVITPQGSPVVSGYMEPVSALKTTLKGNYDNLPEAYVAARQYISKNSLSIDPNGNMFEVYVNDPDEEPNPANWVTEIYMPLLIPEAPENNDF